MLSSSTGSALSKLSYSITRRSASSTILVKLSKRETTLRTPLPVVVTVLEEMVGYELKSSVELTEAFCAWHWWLQPVHLGK